MKEPGVVLVDTGPLVALVDESDSDNKACQSLLMRLPKRVRLVTIQPVLTEAFYLLAGRPQSVEHLFDLLETINPQLLAVDHAQMKRIRVLMRQYKDLPMDYADATLIAVAEEHDISTIMTLDRRDFSVYKPKHVNYFNLLPEID